MDEGSGLPLPDHGLHAGAAKWTREALPHAKPSAALPEAPGISERLGSAHTARSFHPHRKTISTCPAHSQAGSGKAPASPGAHGGGRAHGGGLCAPAEVGKSKLGAVGPGLRPLVSRFSPAWVSCL